MNLEEFRREMESFGLDRRLHNQECGAIVTQSRTPPCKEYGTRCSVRVEEGGPHTRRPFTTLRRDSTIAFQDCESSDEEVAIVRYDKSCVALCLSLKSDGDVEVVMKKVDSGLIRGQTSKSPNYKPTVFRSLVATGTSLQ